MISAVVLTKNEEKNIVDCLQSISWCDEVIVIDDYSSDKTVELANKTGAKVFSRSLDNNFAQQRNYGLQKAEGDWVLFIDADERVSSALWFEMMENTNNPSNPYAGFYLKRRDTLWGKELKYGEVGDSMLLRLARKESGQWKGDVHEVWHVRGKTTVLQNALNHYPHQTISEFLSEINFYSDLRAKELHKKKVKVFWWSIILYPKAKFFVNYIIKRGFLDNLPGFISAIIMSFHSFLVRGKLWLLWQKK